MQFKVISQEFWKGPVILRTPGVRRRTPRTPDEPLFFLVKYGPLHNFLKAFLKLSWCCCKTACLLLQNSWGPSQQSKIRTPDLIFLKYPLFVSPCTLTDYCNLVWTHRKHVFYSVRSQSSWVESSRFLTTDYKSIYGDLT